MLRQSRRPVSAYFPLRPSLMQRSSVDARSRMEFWTDDFILSCASTERVRVRVKSFCESARVSICFPVCTILAVSLLKPLLDARLAPEQKLDGPFHLFGGHPVVPPFRSFEVPRRSLLACRHSLQRLGGSVKPFSWKKACSPALHINSAPHSTQVSVWS